MKIFFIVLTILLAVFSHSAEAKDTCKITGKICWEIIDPKGIVNKDKRKKYDALCAKTRACKPVVR